MVWESTYNIILGLIVSVIWAVITAIQVRQEYGKKKSVMISFTERVDSYFKHIEIHTADKIKLIDKQIDDFRDELNNLVKKKKITEAMLHDSNKIINQNIHDTRIMFLRYVFRSHPKDLNALNFIFADGKVTQTELQILLARIEGSRYFDEDERWALKAQVSLHCVENNRIKTDEELLRSFGIEEKYFLSEKLKYSLYVVPFVLVVVFGLSRKTHIVRNMGQMAMRLLLQKIKNLLLLVRLVLLTP